MEKWKKIKGWPYQVSDLGRVRSIRRRVNATLRRGTETVLTKKILKSAIRKHVIHKNGYCQVMLKNNGAIKMFSVHRLVLDAFKPTKVFKHVNHINLIKTDNRLENLEWVTQSENMQHAVKHGRMHTEKHMLRYKNLIGNTYAAKKEGK